MSASRLDAESNHNKQQFWLSRNEKNKKLAHWVPKIFGCCQPFFFAYFGMPLPEKSVFHLVLNILGHLSIITAIFTIAKKLPYILEIGHRVRLGTPKYNGQIIWNFFAPFFWNDQFFSAPDQNHRKIHFNAKNSTRINDCLFCSQNKHWLQINLTECICSLRKNFQISHVGKRDWIYVLRNFVRLMTLIDTITANWCIDITASSHSYLLLFKTKAKQYFGFYHFWRRRFVEIFLNIFHCAQNT